MIRRAMEQQLLELRVLVAAEVVAGKDAGEVGVEVADAVGEQPLVAEDGRDLAGQRVGVDVGAAQLGDDPVEGLDDLTQQLTGDLARAVGGLQDLDRLAVNSAAQFGDLVARSRADVLGEGADPGVADGRDKVAPFDELAAARLDGVALERASAVGQLGGDLGGRQIGQQGGGEQVHDRQVVA